MSQLPKPPVDLIRRVGCTLGHEDPVEVYEARGLEHWELIKSLLPPDWSFDGRRSLDFGCGAGRILRHAVVENPEGEFWGCDIDLPSVEWLRANLSPPLHVLLAHEWPPLQMPDRHFDLIWAFSVFPHLSDTWSAWMAELHRLLNEGAILVATIFGPGHTSFGPEPVGEDIDGMRVLTPQFDGKGAGPLVFHSEWWVRAHWGRAFEILELRRGHPDGRPPLYGQGVVVMRRRSGVPTREDLERPEPDEPREFIALRRNIAYLQREVIRLSREVDVFSSSRSWRMTLPLRAAARGARALLRR